MDFHHKTTVTLTHPLRHQQVGDTLTLTRAKVACEGMDDFTLYRIPGVGYGISFRALQGQLARGRHGLVESIAATKLGNFTLRGTIPGGGQLSLVVNEGLYFLAERIGGEKAMAFKNTIKATMIRLKFERPQAETPAAVDQLKPATPAIAPSPEKPKQLELFSGQAPAKPDPLVALLEVLPTLSEAAQVRYVELIMGGQAEARRA